MKTYKLENGLTVCHFDKKGFSKSYALLATNYGAEDSIFTTNEGEFQTPHGVAHFLEHKLFEQKDGTNALELFAKTGASPNAFTSPTMTGYYFECTDKFEDNFKILLDYVSNPYFTDENVKKEQGIIGQEIGMVDDTPSWVCYTNLMQAMYHNHPIKESTIGTCEDIASITKEILYLCHKVFYNACNMVLCVVGDVDIDWVLKTAEDMYPKPQTHLISVDYKTEPCEVKLLEISKEMSVSTPLYMIGFKDKSSDFSLKRSVISRIFAELIVGKASLLYERLYADGLINNKFSSFYYDFKEGSAFIFSGEGEKYELVHEILKNELNNFVIDLEAFEIVKKSLIGSLVRTEDSFEDLCCEQVECYFKGSNFEDYYKICKDITPTDVLEFVLDIKDNSSISIVKSK